MPSVPTVREPHPDDYAPRGVLLGITLAAAAGLLAWMLGAWWLW